MTIKTLEDAGESSVKQDDDWYTDIGTEEEKEIIEKSKSYFFVN
jgi:hypothetical protein